MEPIVRPSLRRGIPAVVPWTLVLSVSVALATTDDPPDKLVYLLQYVAADYGAAVREGAVVNELEYGEMVRFSDRVVDRCERSFAGRLSGETLDGLRDLREGIRRLRPREDIRRLAGEAEDRLSRELGVSRVPPASADLARGAEIYRTDCAPCHGASGDGEGRAARGLVPPPSAFRGERMKMVSPHQVYGAARFGIEGTGMPSWEGARSEADLWDVAFHVMTLRPELDRRAQNPRLGLDLADLAASSDEELIARLRSERPDVSPSDLHYYRLHPPPLASAGQAGAEPTAETARTESRGEKGATEPDAELALAVGLQDLFGRIAERTFPSVVGISTWRRTRGATLPARKSDPHWEGASEDMSRHAGFEPVGAGSGFFVTRDGYILTCRHVLIDPRTREVAERIEVELEDDHLEPARVVGLEPTVNLAVLKVELPYEVPAATLGDGASTQVGHWIIAIANPPDVLRTFVPGVVSARANRECYQEQRTSTLLQTSVRVQVESYGGPLVNIRGEVVGISTPRDASIRPDVDPTSAAVYGLPIGLAMTLFEPLRIRESQTSPWIGISVLNLTPPLLERLKPRPPKGLYIDDLFEPSPASRAGIRRGDVLTRIGDSQIFSVPDFQKALYLAGIGAKVDLEVYRAGETFVRRVTIEPRPPEATTR